MPNNHRLPPGPRGERGRGSRAGAVAAPFCHVEKRQSGRSDHYVVHTESPRFVVELEDTAGTTGDQRQAVIRRVCVPNSWAGDYHQFGRLLGAAVAFFESPVRPDAP